MYMLFQQTGESLAFHNLWIQSPFWRLTGHDFASASNRLNLKSNVATPIKSRGLEVAHITAFV